MIGSRTLEVVDVVIQSFPTRGNECQDEGIEVNASSDSCLKCFPVVVLYCCDP